MHLKRYRSETVKDALRAVREDLGPDALVHSTRTVTATGVRGLWGGRRVEITAAAERQVVPENRHVLPAPGPRATSRKPSSMRAIDETAARLQASALDARLANEIAANHPVNRRRGADLESLRATLALELTAMASGDEPYAPVEVFVGPPGAGKTTTIAKVLTQTSPSTEIGVVVNAVRDGDEAALAFKQLDIAATRFLGRSLRYYGFITESRAVRDSVLLQRAVVDHQPQAAASRCFRILASRLAGLGRGPGGLRLVGASALDGASNHSGQPSPEVSQCA